MDEQMKPYHYDKTEIFSREIQPVMDQLYELCEKHNLPCVLTVQPASTPGVDAVVTSKVTRHTGKENTVIDMSPRLLAASYLLTQDQETMALKTPELYYAVSQFDKLRKSKQRENHDS